MWWLGAAHAACDDAAVQGLAQRVAAAAGPDRLGIVAAGWAPLCSDDAVLDGQLAQVPGLAADGRWLVELQTAMIDPRGWWTACGTETAGVASQALSMATKLDAAQRHAHLWSKCSLGRFGSFDEAEWASARGMLLLPLLAASALHAGGIPAEHASPLVRALAEIDSP